MSRTRKCITITAGAAAGLFLTALASSATATADTLLPTIPGVPGVVDQVITGIPQQLLQSTTSALTGGAVAPTPVSGTTLTVPQAPGSFAPSAVPAAGIPGLPGIQMPASISSLLPFPLPNFGGTSLPLTTTTAPSVMVPGTFAPTAPAVTPAPSAPDAWMVVSGLP